MKHKLKWPQISAFRLRRHHFVDQKPVDLASICRNICGVQAQLTAAAEIALWARRHDLTRASIHAALWENRSLVKTSCMRQTLHVIPAADFSIYISALRKSRMAALWRIMSRFGIAPKEIEVVSTAIVDALSSSPMPQRELTEQILPKVGKKIAAYMKLAWNIQLFRAALVEGLICYGPERDNKATFVRADRWLSKQKAVTEAEAKQILLRRYLQAYGPATLQDFAKWMGLPMSEAKDVLISQQAELVEVDGEDMKRFILREDYDELLDSKIDEQTLRLLAHFDAYLLGHADKNHLVDASNYKRVYRNQGWISPVILLDGTVVGTWSYQRRGKNWLLKIEPFEKFSKSTHGKIEMEAKSLGKFLETSWEIKFNKKP